MKVIVTKISDIFLARLACQYTMHSQQASQIQLHDLYACEHSPMRTQIFAIEMIAIPNFVSVHFVRHHVGVDHYVQTMRDDRGGADDANRWTPTNHLMIANAQAVINMARKRLCHKAHPKTVDVMQAIKCEMVDADIVLAGFMVPECVYRGLVCHERKMCGHVQGVRHYREARP